MPNPLNPELLSDRDLALMRQIVIGIAPTAERVTNLSVGRQPGQDSPALLFLEDSVNQATARGTTHIRHAHLAVAFYTFAALDHMRAFVPLLKTKRHIMPLATLTRGAVEAFGKANYLLGAETARELIWRHAGLASHELGNSVQHSKFSYFDGTEVDGNDHLEKLNDLVNQLGMGKPGNIGPTKLASDLLSECSPGSPGRVFYSQLSAIAHGETAGVSMFVESGPDEGLQFVPRRSVLLPYSGMLFSSCKLVLDKMIDHFGVEPEHRHSWRAVTDRAIPWIQELSDSDPNL